MLPTYIQWVAWLLTLLSDLCACVCVQFTATYSKSSSWNIGIQLGASKPSVKLMLRACIAAIKHLACWQRLVSDIRVACTALCLLLFKGWRDKLPQDECNVPCTATFKASCSISTHNPLCTDRFDNLIIYMDNLCCHERSSLSMCYCH